MYSCCIILESIPSYYCHVPYCSHIDQGQFDHSATEHCSCSEAGTAPGLTVIELASYHLLQESNKIKTTYHHFLSKQHIAMFSSAPDFSGQQDAEWKDLWGVCNHKIISILQYRSEFQVLIKNVDPYASGTSYYLQMF